MISLRQCVQKLEPYVCARDLYPDGRVLLDANESPRALIQALGIALNRYPDPEATAIRQALSKRLGVKSDWIVVGNGSDEIIDLTIRSFCDPNDNIVTVQPGYSMYEVCADSQDVTCKNVPLAPEFKVDVRALLAACDAKTKLIMFAAPTVPAGTRVPLSDIETLAREFNGVVFVDEAYAEFQQNGKPATANTAISLVQQYPNLIVSRTLSKAWGLAALRVGYAIANPELLLGLRKLKMPYNVNAASQTLALQALNTAGNAMEENVRQITAERERIAVQLKQRGLTVTPSVTNFVLARFPFAFNSKAVQKQLAEGGIIVRDRSGQPGAENSIRFTVGTREENDEMLTALDNAMNTKVKPA